MPVIKPVGQTTPTYILGQHFLFFRCCQSALCFQLLQQADSSHIVGIPLTGCTYTQIIIGNAEIVALTGRYLRKYDSCCGSCFRLGCRRRNPFGHCNKSSQLVNKILDFDIVPTFHLEVIFKNGINTVFAMHEVQATGHGFTSIHSTQRLHLGSGDCLVGCKCVLKC